MPSLYASTVPVFIKHLTTLSKLLAKGEATATTAEAKEALLATRLVPDMADLTYQIQRVSDTAKGLAVRVGGIAPVAMADNEKTFEDLYARIEKTIDVLKSVPESAFEGKDTAEILFPTRTETFKFTGDSYATDFAIPNFYFHYTIAYALLRHKGVDVGKNDYLGRN